MSSKRQRQRTNRVLGRLSGRGWMDTVNDLRLVSVVERLQALEALRRELDVIEAECWSEAHRSDSLTLMDLGRVLGCSNAQAAYMRRRRLLERLGRKL